MASAIRKSRRRVTMKDNSNLQVFQEPREPPLNPMLIDVILSNMFGFLDFEDLAQCRSVSKQWHRVSLQAWLTKGPTLELKLYRNKRNSLYNDNRSLISFLGEVHADDDDDDDADEFRAYGPCEYSGLRQYRKFAVIGYANGPEQQNLLHRFLRICGHSMTELKVAVVIPGLYTYQALHLSTMSPNLVTLRTCIRLSSRLDVEEEDKDKESFAIMEETQGKLTCLEIDYPPYANGSLSSLPTSGWIQLLRRYPNLKSLLVGERGMEWPMYMSVGPPIPPNPQHGSDIVLQSLLPALRVVQLSLETLEMCLGWKTSAQTIAAVLGSQAATLKSLRLAREHVLRNFKPPELPYLQSLELRGRPLPSLDSLTRFPRLESLTISSLTFIDDGNESRVAYDQLARLVRATGATGEEGCSIIVLPTLTKLHCDYGRGVAKVKNPLGPADVRKLAGIFPNLTDLGLWLDNETLGPVVQLWPSLQHLTILGARVDDNGISGVVREFPRMTDLKFLAMKHFRGPTALTAKSLIKFLKLPNLERLEISLDEQLSVGPVTLRKVEANIKNFKLTRETTLDEDENETDSDDDRTADDSSDDDNGNN